MLFLIPGILLTWYFYIFALTEILSLFKLINIYSLVASQTFYFVCLLFYLLKIKKISLNLPKLKFWQIIVISLPILTLIQGFFSAPATTDSMVYHLPRVMYWLQDGTVSQSYVRNSHDFMAPFAEYIVLNLYSLTNSDRLAFLSQLIAYLGSVVVLCCIAKKFLNLNNLWPIIILSLTLPIALLQSSSTQTDMVTTVLTLISIYYALEFRKNLGYKNALFLGISLGLGVLTKATFVIYAIIPAAIILYTFIQNYKLAPKLLGYCLLILFVSLVIQVRFLSQNLYLYGNLSGQPILEEGSSYSNEKLGINVLISNFIRNSFLHLPVPLFNINLTLLIDQFLNILGTSINDPATTYPNTTFKVLPIIFPQEDIVSNPIHFLLIILTLIAILINFRKFNFSILTSLFILNLASFLIFCLILKWQPFHSRLQIPFLLIGSTIGFIILTSSKFKAVLKPLLFASVILAFILVTLNVSKPVISYSFFYNLVSAYSPANASVPEAFYLKPRTSQYFNSRYYWQTPYTEIVNRVGSSQSIAFKLMDEYEYPFWILLREKGLSFKIVSPENAQVIISTSESKNAAEGFFTECFKTQIDYGYACISIKN